MSEGYQRNWAPGRARLQTIAAKADPDTRRHLDELGIADGWNCLEVGAGSGTLSRWMAQRVAPTGHVLATDLDTRLLDEHAAPNVEIKKLDVDADPLPAKAYDLIVARYVFEWLRAPEATLAKLVTALRPGGWLLIESGDWNALPPVSGDDANARRIRDAIFDFIGKMPGYNPDVGRQLVGRLEHVGLRHVGATGRSTLLRGGSPETQLYKYELEMIGQQMLDAGKIAETDLAALLKIYDDPTLCMMSSMTITTWGRKPEA